MTYLCFMIDSAVTVAFTGHRTYRGEAGDALRRAVVRLYGRGFRTFLSGMAVGFDLAAAEAVLELRDGAAGRASLFEAEGAPAVGDGCRERMPDGAEEPFCGMPGSSVAPSGRGGGPYPDLRLVAVVPFEGQQARFSAGERRRYERVLAAADKVVVLAPAYRRGCYAVRNDFLAAHAALLVAWYDGSPGGTQYTLKRALRLEREVWNLHPAVPLEIRPAPKLF